MSAQRRALWDKGINGAPVKILSDKLDALYEEKRRASAPAGTPAAKERAEANARAEKELDRLMQA